MKKNICTKHLIFAWLLVSLLTASCNKESLESVNDRVITVGNLTLTIGDTLSQKHSFGAIATEDATAPKNVQPIPANPPASFLPLLKDGQFISGRVGAAEAIDLSARFPAVRDQGTSNACVGFATTYARGYFENVFQNVNSFVFSPAFIYNKKDNDQQCASGMHVYWALQTMLTTGVPTEDVYPFSNLCNFNVPDLTASATPYKIKSYYASYKSSNPVSVETMKNWLSIGYPVLISLTVDSDFNYWNANGKTLVNGVPITENTVLNSPLGSAVIGNHAVVLTGYDNAKGAFKLLNQWGIGWGTTNAAGNAAQTGQRGYIWISYDALMSRMTAAYLMVDRTTRENLPPALEQIYIPIGQNGANSVQLTAVATDPEGGQLSYQWSVTPNTFKTTSLQSAYSILTDVAPGTYSYTVVITDDKGSSIQKSGQFVMQRTYTLATVDIPDQTINMVDPNAEKGILINVQMPVGIAARSIKYDWDYGDGTTSSYQGDPNVAQPVRHSHKFPKQRQATNQSYLVKCTITVTLQDGTTHSVGDTGSVILVYTTKTTG